MLTAMRFAVALLALSLAPAAGCGALPSPRITAVVPDHAAPDAPVDVLGEGFAGEGPFAAIGGLEAVTPIWEPRRIRLLVPELAAGVTSLVVTVDGHPSAPARFVVDPPAP